MNQQDQFKQCFEARFAELLNQGQDRTSAAAEAIRYASSRIQATQATPMPATSEENVSMQLGGGNSTSQSISSPGPGSKRDLETMTSSSTSSSISPSISISSSISSSSSSSSSLSSQLSEFPQITPSSTLSSMEESMGQPIPFPPPPAATITNASSFDLKTSSDSMSSSDLQAQLPMEETETQQPLRTYTFDDFTSLIDSGHVSGNYEPLIELINLVFSDVRMVGASFEDKDWKHNASSSSSSSVTNETVKNPFQSDLFASTTTNTATTSIMTQANPSVPMATESLGTTASSQAAATATTSASSSASASTEGTSTLGNGISSSEPNQDMRSNIDGSNDGADNNNDNNTDNSNSNNRNSSHNNNNSVRENEGMGEGEGGGNDVPNSGASSQDSSSSMDVAGGGDIIINDSQDQQQQVLQQQQKMSHTKRLKSQSEDEYEGCNISRLFPIDRLKSLYRSILDIKDERVNTALRIALETLTLSMTLQVQENLKQSWLLISFLVTMEHPELLDPVLETVTSSLITAVDKSFHSRTKLLCVEWLMSPACRSERFLQYVVVLRQFITFRLIEGAMDDAKMATRVLAIFFRALSSHPKVALSEFYNDAINDDYMQTRRGKQVEFSAWVHDHQRTRQFKSKHRIRSSSGFNLSELRFDLDKELKSFISFPFVLSPSCKAMVLELDARSQMQREIDHEITAAIMRGSQFAIPYLILRVSRERILSDTLSLVMHYEGSDFKKPLKVIFDDEEGVDAGGLKKEFYQLMLKQLFDPAFGMFREDSDSHLLWFNADSLESNAEYELVGLLLGIAIYNSIIIDFPFPLAVYRKLKKEPLSLNDLKDLNPQLGKGLQELLDFEGDVEETFGFVFQMTYEVFGETRTVDLKPDGGNIPVNNTNRKEYVALYINYLLNISVSQQFEAFEKGFRRVCGGPAIDLFEATEIDLLVCGSRKLDFYDLQRGTQYEDGYEETSPTIAMFWKVLHSLSEDEKKLFLKFVSGSDRAPIDGLSKLKMVISKNGDDDLRLPSAHTCFNHLLLPTYSSEDVMRTKVKYAITSSAEGFGLR